MMELDTDASVVRSWRRALTGLDGLQAYPFHAVKKRRKLKQLASDTRLLAACQAAAVGSVGMTPEMLALLLVDATEGSLDALLPHVERARTERALFEQFDRLQRYGGPETTALFAVLGREWAEKRVDCQVLALAERFGLVTANRFRLKLVIRAEKPVKRSTFDEVKLSFDSAKAPGFALSRAQVTSTPNSTSSWQRTVVPPTA